MSQPLQSSSHGETCSGYTRGVGILSDSLWTSRMLAPPAHVLLARLGPYTPKEQRVSTSLEYCSYLANLIDMDLEEELLSLTYYTWHASIFHAIIGASRWDVFLFDKRSKEK